MLLGDLGFVVTKFRFKSILESYTVKMGDVE